MKIEQNSQVKFSYTVKDSNGTVLSSSKDSEAAVYIHGYSLILPKLEEALTGKAQGESFSVFVPKDEGYGEYQKALVFEVEKSIFHSDVALEVGMEFQDETTGNAVKIVELRGDKVLVDANHPYSGKDLTFDIVVEAVEPASEEDLKALQEMLSHHSHGCGCGCHGGCDDGCGCGCDSQDCEGDCDCGCGC